MGMGVLLVCVWVFCLCAVCMTDEGGGQKRILDLLIELQKVVSHCWVLGIKSASLGEQSVFLTAEPSSLLLYLFFMNCPVPGI